MAPVNPFIDRIPADEQEDFMEDFVRTMADTDSTSETILNGNFPKPYKLMIAYARK